MTVEPRRSYGVRLRAALVTGALAGFVGCVVVGFGLLAPASLGADAAPAVAFQMLLARGGWVWIPLWSAALAALLVVGQAPGTRERVGTVLLAAVLAALPLVFRPALPRFESGDEPRTARAKTRAILRWSYRTPVEISRIVALARDPDPRVREQAVLAMGVNRIVTDVERASERRPSRLFADPVRDSLRIGLLVALHDPIEDVRAEAARALWKAPRTFGAQPAAAETLAAVLDRALRPGAVARRAWLALDAAGGAPHPKLRAAAERFAQSTADTALAGAAHRALARSANDANSVPP